MKFDLSEDDRVLVDGVRGFCERAIVPHAARWDEEESLPPGLAGELAELGLLGLEVPERYGGVGLSAVAATEVVAELAKASAAVALSVAAHNALVLGHLLADGTEEQKERWLGPLVTGGKLGAWALSEPQAGTDVRAISTVAQEDGDGFVLRGEKHTVTHGSRAALYVVFAKLGAEDGPMTAFLVEGGAPGLTARRVPTLGVCACDVADVVLDGVRVGSDALLGTPGRAWETARRLLDRGRIHVAGIAVGIGEASLAAARSYARERRQFGRPIADFQAIRWKLADMATTLTAARLMTRKAADAWDRGERVREAAARAKVFAAEAAVRAANDALQIHGGYGYTREYPVERFLRDARLCGLGEGTSDVMRMVLARRIARRFGAAASA